VPSVTRWSPGRRFVPAIPGHSWWRPDGDRAIIAVALTWPKLQPAWDGSKWSEPEVWTVRFPLHEDETIDPAPGDDFGNGVVFFLHDKPHRITWWDEDEGAREVLERLPVSKMAGVRLTDDFGLIWYVTARDRRAWRQWRKRACAYEARDYGRRRWGEVRRHRHWLRQAERDA
jgi:hypothetical protein